MIFWSLFADASPLHDALPNALSSALLKPAEIADDSLPTTHEILHWSQRLTHAAEAAGIAIAVALALHYLLFTLLRSFAKKSSSEEEAVAVNSFNQSIRWSMVTIGFVAASTANYLLSHIWKSIDRFVVPILVGWVVLASIKALSEVLHRRNQVEEDWIAARSSHTRITLLTRVVDALVIVTTLAMIMLGFPEVRRVGATLIASAGLIGLAVGAAAQPALKALIAGIQIAFTQPLRIGDYVVLDNESGRVEDIRFSYVVIRTGDERRLIVPTTKFLDSSFQNWTRSTGISGSITLPVRPGTEIAPIRTAFEQLLEQQEKWDGRSATLTVSAALPGLTELTMTMSAKGPADLSDLKPAVREAMLEWLRTTMPEALCLQALLPDHG